MQNTQVINDYRVTAVMSQHEASFIIEHIPSGKEVNGPYLGSQAPLTSLRYFLRTEDVLIWIADSAEGEAVVYFMECPVRRGVTLSLVYRKELAAVTQMWSPKLDRLEAEHSSPS